jgi:hypothetical protein
LAGCLTAKATKIVCDMTRNLIKPKNILMDLKGRRKDNMTILKQIYNAHDRYKLSISGSRTAGESKKTIQDIFLHILNL